jgi:murein DD-endopeptidase MepM/ murein hydrolase activator NlpD
MWVVLRHADGTRTVYGHINRSLVSVGQTVSAGEEIAEVGNRGQSTGPHLHFEIWDAAKNKMNPLPILQAMGLRPAGDGANSPD